MITRSRFYSTVINELKNLPSHYAQQTILRSIERTRTPPITGSRLIFKTSYSDLADFRGAVLEAKKFPVCETSRFVLDILGNTNECNVNSAKAIVIQKHNDPLIVLENLNAAPDSNTFVIDLHSFRTAAQATNNLAQVQVMSRPHISWALVSCGVVAAIIIGFPYLV
jgi:hypothetical protein